MYTCPSLIVMCFRCLSVIDRSLPWCLTLILLPPPLLGFVISRLELSHISLLCRQLTLCCSFLPLRHRLLVSVLPAVAPPTRPLLVLLAVASSPRPVLVFFLVFRRHLVLCWFFLVFRRHLVLCRFSPLMQEVRWAGTRPKSLLTGCAAVRRPKALNSNAPSAFAHRRPLHCFLTRLPLSSTHRDPAVCKCCGRRLPLLV